MRALHVGYKAYPLIDHFLKNHSKGDQLLVYQDCNDFLKNASVRYRGVRAETLKLEKWGLGGLVSMAGSFHVICLDYELSEKEYLGTKGEWAVFLAAVDRLLANKGYFILANSFGVGDGVRQEVLRGVRSFFGKNRYVTAGAVPAEIREVLGYDSALFVAQKPA